MATAAHVHPGPGPGSQPDRSPGAYCRPIGSIGTLNEGSLHAALKELYAEPGDEFEFALDGFVIDIRRRDRLIEIQTGSFGAMGRKLDRLLSGHRVLVVHPLAVETYLHKGEAKPRRSPKRRTLYSMFDELVSMPTLLDHPHFELEIVLTVEDRIQVEDADLRRRRGGWRTVDRRLREVRSRHRFRTVDDLVPLVPPELPAVFNTADLAAATGISRPSAQKMAFCLRATGLFDPVRRTRQGVEYRRR
ncbi:MAG: hypothetical protein ACFCVK_11875 [Acidimicrobiales bacterium]